MRKTFDLANDAERAVSTGARHSSWWKIFYSSRTESSGQAWDASDELSSITALQTTQHLPHPNP